MMLNNLGGSRREGEILYMCMYVNTLAYLCKLRNVYNMTTNLLIEEPLVVMVAGLGKGVDRT